MFIPFLRMAKGAALAALFSVTCSAQEIVTPGNSKTPHQPPAWFVRMANPEVVVSPERDFFVYEDRSSSSYGRPTAGVGGKKFCGLKKDEKGVLVWRFCDM